MLTFKTEKMTEKEKGVETVKRGRELVKNEWVDNVGRTWKFGLGQPNLITAYINGEKFIDNDQVLSVLDKCTYWLYNGDISLGRILEDHIVEVKYRGNYYGLRKL